nr:unnamed protein product [Digitaria exilis]
MTDMRRHSVDVPLSRTLVQLKRVRSLRDPATNSLSKYASPSDHMIWETASSNGMTLDLGRSARHQLVEEDEDLGAEATMGSERSFRAPNARTASYRKSSAVRIRGLNPPRNKQVHRVRQDVHRKSLDSNHSNHSSIRQLANNMVNNLDAEKEEEEVNSYERPNFALPDKDDEEVKMPSYSKFRTKSSAAMSRVGSPCRVKALLKSASLVPYSSRFKVGSVSDDELIELLDLALSSDTTNTVRRARELMGSAIDPLQLVSQLANLIMDILSGRCQSAATEVSKSFLGRYALSEVGIKKLRHALKILSDTEKQLRTSRNQATWVTVALLQFGTTESNIVAEPNDMHAHSVTGYTELAIAEVGFGQPDHLSRAEKMQSLIECSLQHVLGCNVEIRFKLVACPVRKDARLKRQSFSFLNCSGRKQELSDSVVTDEDEAVRPGARETPLKGYTSSQQESPYIMQRVDSKPSVHGCEDDARSTLTSNRSMTDDLTRTCRSETNYSKGVSEQGRFDSTQEPDLQPNCFSRTLKLQKKLLSSGAAHTICLRIQPHNKMDFLPKKEFDTYFCAYEPYEQCSRSNSRATYSSRDDDL